MKALTFYSLSCVLFFAHSEGIAAYLKDMRETRIVVEVSESAVTELGAASEQLEREVSELLRLDPVGPAPVSRSHDYIYLRLVADVVSDQQYHGMLDIRVVRPVVIVGIGRVAVAAVWEESEVLSGTVPNFQSDVHTVVRKILAKLKRDWSQDNSTP